VDEVHCPHGSADRRTFRRPPNDSFAGRQPILNSFAIPCSPDGVHMQLALEVFTNIYFGPGRIVVTESMACGVSGCATLATGQSTILHRTR